MKSLGTKWKTYTESERQEILKQEIAYLIKVWGSDSYEVKSWKARLARHWENQV